MKIYTCGLMPFKADDTFFARDSGLLCRSLRSLGVESHVILPRGACLGDVDPEEVVRADQDEFGSPEWWGSLKIDAVVFITWGFKQHTPIIRAARAAGIKTCAIFETGGNSFPYGDFSLTIKTFWRKGGLIESAPKRFIGTVVRCVYFGFKGIAEQYERSVQIGIPDIAAFDTPTGMERCQKTARLFPWLEWNSKEVLLGYPTPDFPLSCALGARRANIVAIARWDALRHKRPNILMAMIDRVLPLHPSVTFEIFGRLTPSIEQWHRGIEKQYQERVLLRGIQPSTVISEALATSRILYCPSASDGIPLAVIEGLCGGCSVAGLRTLEVPGLYWAASEGDGTLAFDDSIKAHAAAVLAELAAWEEGLRDPLSISKRWKSWFSGREVAQKIVRIFGSDFIVAS